MSPKCVCFHERARHTRWGCSANIGNFEIGDTCCPCARYRPAQVRVGAAAAKRRRQGGKKATGRASATVAEYLALTARLIARSGGYCEVHGKPEFGTEVCHVVARSQGGPDDEWNTYWGCRAANRQQQASFAAGRLVACRVMVNYVKGIDWAVIRATSKWAYQRGEYETLATGFIRA